MTHHLVVLKRPHLNQILDGTKTVELRLSKTRRAPYQRVRRGDKLWLKLAGGPIVATAKAKWVKGTDQKTGLQISDLLRPYADAVGLEPDRVYWPPEVRYATLIALDHVRRVLPFHIEKSNRLAWVALPCAPRGRHGPSNSP